MQASSSSTSLLSHSSSSTVVKHVSYLLTLKKRIKAFETMCMRKLLHISYPEHKTNDWVQSKINFLVGPQEPPLAHIWQLLRDGNLHGSGMSHATTASPKPSSREPWRVGEAVVGRENAGWTTSKSEHICPGQNCSQGAPAEKKKKNWKNISAESALTSPRQPNRSRD